MSYHIAEPVCAGAPLSLIVEACGPCVHLDGWMPSPLRVQATMDLSNCILEICQVDSLAIPIGTFAAGHYFMLVQVFGAVLHPDSTMSCTAVQFDSVLFDVPQGCPPSPRPLPYTDVIRIGPPPPCATCPPPPICPGDSIPFHIAGLLPNPCYEFRGLELLPSPLAGPRPYPPIARVTIAHDECSGVACPAVMVPWEANAVLPSLPGGDYGMIVELRDVIECGSQPPLDTLYTTTVPFHVAASCGPPTAGCFLYGWGGDTSDSSCTTHVGPGSPGHVTFNVTAFTPLAGLQGRFTLDPAALEIAGLKAVGPAAGMHLVWQPLTDGASFVLFADQGAPIRPPQCDSCPPQVAVLEATLAQRPGVPIPPLSLLDVVNLAAADSAGHLVSPCPTFAAIPPAHLCDGASCDFNRDGHLDIRDLALMVRCVRDPGTCPDSASQQFDCNGDGRMGYEDAVCCAPEAIRHHIPADAVTRPASGLHATTGSPVNTGGSVEIPIHVARADLVGAARLAFKVEPGRFSAAFAYAPDDSAGWFLPCELSGNELLMGMLVNGPMFPGAGLDIVLHLTLAAGQPPSDVVLIESEFAGIDGVALSLVDLPAGVPLSNSTRIRLSAAQPNPFGGETRFVLTLAQASETDVAVFDLSGRRIATLLHGSLAAGSYPIRWDGARSGGGRARDGVYLLRAEGVGAAATRKLVLLHGP